jgi:16S rRNA (uracil1498-N3)-methyltransferase
VVTPQVARIATRIHCAEPLREAARIDLGEGPAHYLRHVLRLPPGAEIALFNGQYGEFAGRIDGFAKSRVTIVLGACRRAPGTEPDLWLCFAPIKRTRLDAMVEKATELGVARLMPVFTRHTVMERVNRERLAAIAAEAAGQCERLSVPVVDEPVAFEELLAHWPADRPLITADESGGGTPIAEALAGLSGPLAVLTGPEGGFARSELDALGRAVFVRRVGLGPRILRADTAAIAALAIVQAVAGDGARAPRGVAQDEDARD